ncbi:Alpha/beta knot methyltransferase [Aspergillus egyptiacus]|nr:Alpha/beta knot methyltransferase [Aspergillus egyptiacus]
MSVLTQFSRIRLPLRVTATSALLQSTIRYASLNSAIGHGIRRSQRLEEEPQSSSSRSRDRSSRSAREPPGPTNKRGGREDWSEPSAEFDEDEFVRTGNFRPLRTKNQKHRRSESARPSDRTADELRSRKYDGDFEDVRRLRRSERAKHHRPTNSVPERVKEHVRVPETIPYTTPASEFIYGAAAVEAALRCSRRKLYKLYIYQAGDEELSDQKIALRKLALTKNIKVKMCFAEWVQLLNRVSKGRPHNGCILEASPLPRTPVRGLKPVQAEDDHFRVELAPQTREEAEVNGTSDIVPVQQQLFSQHRRKYPIVVLLDGVVDPGNLGAIIRSCYYLGVDAVVFAGRNSAPISPIAIKASAGAADNMTYLDVTNEVDFVKRSKANGWRFYAADAPRPGATYINASSSSGGNAATATTGDSSMIGNSPSVIMMGSEATGLSKHIKNQADAIISIPGSRLDPLLGVMYDAARVDSLNVSVATALLVQMFLRVPLGVSSVPVKEDPQ